MASRMGDWRFNTSIRPAIRDTEYRFRQRERGARHIFRRLRFGDSSGRP